MEFKQKRILSLATAVFEGGIYSGVLIGWSSLVFILKSEGEIIQFNVSNLTMMDYNFDGFSQKQKSSSYKVNHYFTARVLLNLSRRRV